MTVEAFYFHALSNTFFICLSRDVPDLDLIIENHAIYLSTSEPYIYINSSHEIALYTYSITKKCSDDGGRGVANPGIFPYQVVDII